MKPTEQLREWLTIHLWATGLETLCWPRVQIPLVTRRVGGSWTCQLFTTAEWFFSTGTRVTHLNRLHLTLQQIWLFATMSTLILKEWLMFVNNCKLKWTHFKFLSDSFLNQSINQSQLTYYIQPIQCHKEVMVLKMHPFSRELFQEKNHLATLHLWPLMSGNGIAGNHTDGHTVRPRHSDRIRFSSGEKPVWEDWTNLHQQHREFSRWPRSKRDPCGLIASWRY